MAMFIAMDPPKHDAQRRAVAVAKSNIFVNAPNETKYSYQDADEDGTRLNGANRYTLTFPQGKTPPVNGFWSLTLYNNKHFFFANLGGQGLKVVDRRRMPFFVSSSCPCDLVATI